MPSPATTPAALATYDVVIVGGGSAGLAAAIAARDAGSDSVVMVERDDRLGGILNQCIHNGFGLHTFKEELTGPEYAARFIAQADERRIERLLKTTVLDIRRTDANSNPSAPVDPTAPADPAHPIDVCCVNAERGVFHMRAASVVLAMGCRERARGALDIPGTRPAGVYTAGCAQHLVNIEGQLPGRRVVILGSGDIGLIMARRLTLEGATVACVAEVMPYSGGLKRNIVQCLDDFDIPLLLSHTVVDIEGERRVEAVTITRVDEKSLRPIPGTERRIECDTLLLSVGLLPENELSSAAGVSISPTTRGPLVNESLQTSVPGVFACGNVLHVHDLVDYVSEEAAHAGASAAAHAQALQAATPTPATSVAPATPDFELPIECANGVRYTVPTTVAPARMGRSLKVRFRVSGVFENRHVSVYVGERRIYHKLRPMLAPGEMQEVILVPKQLEGARPGEKIRVLLEEE